MYIKQIWQLEQDCFLFIFTGYLLFLKLDQRKTPK